jgi:hypothetical protein
MTRRDDRVHGTLKLGGCYHADEQCMLHFSSASR